MPSKIHGASVILRWTIGFPTQKPLTGHALITLMPKEGGGWIITQGRVDVSSLRSQSVVGSR